MLWQQLFHAATTDKYRQRNREERHNNGLKEHAMTTRPSHSTPNDHSATHGMSPTSAAQARHVCGRSS